MKLRLPSLAGYFKFSIALTAIAIVLPAYILLAHRGSGAVPFLMLLLFVFIMPALAANSLLTSLVLLAKIRSRNWIVVVLLQCAAYSTVAYLTLRPSEVEANYRADALAQEAFESAYVAALKVKNFPAAETLVRNAVGARQYPGPRNISCLSEKFDTQTLEFSLDLAKKMAAIETEMARPCPIASWAITSGKLDVAKIAIQNGDDIHESDVLAIVESIPLEAGEQRENWIRMYEFVDQAKLVSRSWLAKLLAAAAKSRSEKLMAAILQSAGGAAHLDDKGMAAITAASASDGKELDFLLEHGVDIDGHSEGRGSALDYAVWPDKGATTNIDIVRRLLQHGADAKRHSFPIVKASEDCNPALVEVLLQFGAPADVVIDPPEKAPLFLTLNCLDSVPALRPREQHLATTLIRHGARYDRRSAPMLVNLCMNGHAKHAAAIEFLKQAGARIDQRDGEGKTALMVKHDDVNNAVEELIACGADVNARDLHHKTALDYSVTSHDEVSAKALCKHGAQPTKLCPR